MAGLDARLLFHRCHHTSSSAIFTTKKVEDLREIANKVFPTTMNVMGKRLSVEKLDQIAGAIEKRKPHGLSKLFDKAGINRWSVLNKNLMTEDVKQV